MSWHAWRSAGSLIDPEQQVLIKRWINDLQQGCSNEAYQRSEISLSENDQPELDFSLNGESYQFGTFNTYAGRHYLYHKNNVYLCVPTLRPRLENAKKLWIKNDA